MMNFAAHIAETRLVARRRTVAAVIPSASELGQLAWYPSRSGTSLGDGFGCVRHKLYILAGRSLVSLATKNVKPLHPDNQRGR